MHPRLFFALMDRWKRVNEQQQVIQEREDYRAGLNASVAFNMQLDKKNKHKAMGPLDWFKSKEEKKKPQSMEQQKNVALKMAMALGGEVIMKNERNR